MRLTSSLSIGLLLAVFGLLGGPPAHGQAPTAMSVENSSANPVLKAFGDGGLLAPAQSASAGDIPATGAGTRLMWYPGKYAFRAGRVGVDLDGTQWDDSQVGAYSVAFGNDTKASGASSTAVGHQTTASGKFATAMGSGSTASGKGATAMGGAGTLASGFLSTAMGGDTEASAAEATAMGFNTTASASQATAMGLRAVARAVAATAMGEGTRAATEKSLTIGKYNDRNRGNDDADPTTGPLFVVGNGSSGARSDALVLEQSGNMTISGTLAELSDRRLKTVLEPLGENVLQKVSEIRPVRYEFKNQETHPAGEQIGLIAQDVRTEFPELVSKGGDGMLSLSYSKFTAVLLKGLQEQQTQIERQETRIDSLEREVDRLDRMEKRLARLEAQDRSVAAGIPMTELLLGGLVGGLLGAGLVWRRRD